MVWLFKIINIFIILFCTHENFVNSAVLYIEEIYEKCEFEFNDELMIDYKLCTNITLNSDDELTGEAPKLTDIRFKNCKIPKFRANFAKLFKATRNIEITNCSIESIDDDFSENLSHFIYSLKLSDNEIEYLPSNCLQQEERLEMLDLSRNHLKTLPRDIFRNTVSLKQLFLQGNRFKDLQPFSNVLEPLTELLVIDMSDNEIHSIPNDFFEENINLRKIIMKNNKIKIFDENLLQFLNNVKLLDLSYNPLINFNFTKSETVKATNTDLQICNIKTHITNVYVNNSKVEKIILNKDVTVRKLFLSNNLLTEFEKNNLNELNILKEITHLDLSMNNINGKSINLENMLNLKFLNLSNIKISANDGSQNLNYNIFTNIHKLEILDLSKNNLKQFDMHLLRPLIDLKYLYLNDNNLTNIKYDDKDLLKMNLKEIDLRNNLWTCSYLLQIIDHFISKNIHIRFIDQNFFINSDNISSKIGCHEDGNYIEIHETTEYGKSITKIQVANNNHNHRIHEQKYHLNTVINLLITLLVFVIIVLISLIVALYKIWQKISYSRSLNFRNPLIGVNTENSVIYRQ